MFHSIKAEIQYILTDYLRVEYFYNKFGGYNI